jgi:hypothetical protein
MIMNLRCVVSGLMDPEGEGVLPLHLLLIFPNCEYTLDGQLFWVLFITNWLRSLDTNVSRFLWIGWGSMKD